MQQNNRAEGGWLLTEALHHWETEALVDALHTAMIDLICERFDNRDHDPDCDCHDWRRMMTRDAMKAWRKARDLYFPDCDLPFDVTDDDFDDDDAI